MYFTFKYLKTHRSTVWSFWVFSLHLSSGSWTYCPESQAGSEPIDSCNTRCSSKSTKASVSAYRGKVSQSNKEELWGQRSRTRLTFCVGERWREYYREIHSAVDIQSMRTTRKWRTLHCFTLILPWQWVVLGLELFLTVVKTHLEWLIGFLKWWQQKYKETANVQHCRKAITSN